METPEMIEAQDRKNNLIKVIQGAKMNPAIDDEKIKDFLWYSTKEMEFYKYYGDHSKLKEFMDNEIENNTYNLKDFIEQDVGGITIYNMVLTYLI